MKPLFGLLAASASIALLAACPASLDDRCAEGACETRESPEAGAPSAKEPPGCVYGQGPSESPACIVDTYAVFVSPTGNNAAAGTKAAPLQTIDAAVGKATAEGKPHIYVCTGAYKSSVTITRKTSIFGIACDFATPVTSDKPKWTGASPASVASIVGVQPRVVLADLDITAMDADPQGDGQSSIGILVADSTDVELRNVNVTAGRASSGKNATSKDVALPAPKGLAAPDGTTSSGGEGAKNLCADGESTGGHGAGTGSNPPATAGQPALGQGAAGVPAASCTATAQGQTGGAGAEGAHAPKPTLLGTLASAGWKPAVGAKGANGKRAQGGGGGSFITGAGGGGGAGGCGGEGGEGGNGGGASVALVAVASSVKLTSSKLTSGIAGNGGTGAAGQLGQPGGGSGGGGRVAAGTDGCSGGSGGKGGDGGAGAGGAAGIAPAILFKGAQIVKEGTSLAAGTAGAPGLGGKSDTNDGLVAPTGEQLEMTN